MAAAGLALSSWRGGTSGANSRLVLGLAPSSDGLPAARSRIEQPHDLLLSTLNAYLQAVGGHARVIVQFADGHEVDLDLSALTVTREELTLTVQG